MKGGARARSGPGADPNALRRNRADDAEWVTLPAQGRTGAPPKWPLTKQVAREKVLWARLWKLPQATEWERCFQELEVALYVRRLMEAEMVGALPARSTLVRQMSDSLGLTTPGMRANRWRIEAKAPATVRQASSSRSRARLKVVAHEDRVAGA